MNKDTRFQLSSTALHLLAMGLMLCDHLWGTVVPGNDWLTAIGRLSFPIFAFLLVEGYFHTKNFKRYLLRMLLFAVLSELPFNLALGGRLFYPIHQNVLWSFFIALVLIHWNERAKDTGKLWMQIPVCILSLLCSMVGLLTMLDYYHAGILMVLVFYFFRRKSWLGFLGQLVCLWYINFEILGGFGYEYSLWGHDFFFPRQGFALLALIPIWLYRGKQGYRSKWLQYTCYAFYPVHLLILGLIQLL